jgi:hypothetical protein
VQIEADVHHGSNAGKPLKFGQQSIIARIGYLRQHLGTDGEVSLMHRRTQAFNTLG